MSTDDHKDADHTAIISTAKGSGHLAGGSFFEFGSRFVIAVVLARTLGASDYGLYVLAVSAAGVFAGIASLGLDDAMTRHVAISSGRNDRAAIMGTLQIGFVGAVGAGLVMAVVLFVAARPVASGWFDEPRLASLLRVVALAVPLLTVSNVLSGTARGFGKMHFVAIAENGVQSIVRVVLTVAIVVLTGTISVMVATVAFVVSDVAATVVFVLLLVRHFPVDRELQSNARRETRGVVMFALPLWVSSLLRQSRRNIQTVLLGTSRSVSSAGVFSIVDKVNTVGHVWLLSLFVAVKPELARLHDRGDRRELGRLYATSTRWSLELTLPFVLVSVLFREAILRIFGGSFEAGATALVILSCAELVNAATGVCGPAIDMTGHTRTKVANSVVFTAILIATNALLIPEWGVIGAAVAALLATTVFNALCIVEMWVFERLLPFDASSWKPLAAGAGAFMCGLALDVLLPLDRVGAMVALAPVICAVYAGLLLSFGLPTEDRLVIARALSKIPRPRRRRVTAGDTAAHDVAIG
ncbi:MAG TPA: oligosaccharide flippase family protein [Acidimicrobiia bacterium]|nr:oligosaccharide flippase family protein [Acidimicrobiia bacterium]